MTRKHQQPQTIINDERSTVQLTLRYLILAARIAIIDRLYEAYPIKIIPTTDVRTEIKIYVTLHQ